MEKTEHQGSRVCLREINLFALKGKMSVWIFSDGTLKANHDCDTSPEDPATQMRIEYDGMTAVFSCPECGIKKVVKNLNLDFPKLLDNAEKVLADGEYVHSPSDTF